MRDPAENLKTKNAAYAEIIDFYERIHREQSQAKKDLDALLLFNPGTAGIDAPLKEGFPLFNKHDISVDVPSSAALFTKLTEISRQVNQKLHQNIHSIEQAIRNNSLDVGELVRRHSDEAYLAETAAHAGADLTVLKFLVHMSILPSLQILGNQIRDSGVTGSWLRGYCPVCGSFPRISALRGEGQRFFLCDFCSYEWMSERLKCPFCENVDHRTLHYFSAEGDEARRVDLCEKCKKYLKTIDTRKLPYEPDLQLEDIVTVHLDILASERGFSTPSPSPWGAG